jgi:hypothetical protein
MQDEIVSRIPALSEISFEMGRVVERLEVLENKVDPQPAWYDLKTAARIKGLNLNTLRSRQILQPNKGIPDGIISGKKMWRRETILRWIDETDYGPYQPQ